MKIYLVLIMLLISNFWSFSQNLKPKIQSIEGETHFCFTITQSKIIANQLQERAYADSIIKIYKNNTIQLKKLLLYKNDIIVKKDMKSDNLNRISNNQSLQITELKLDLKREQKRSKKRGFFNKIGAIIAVLTGILIAK